MVYHILADRTGWRQSDLAMIPIQVFDNFELPDPDVVTSSMKEELKKSAFLRFRHAYLMDYENQKTAPLVFKADWHPASCAGEFVDVNPLPYIYEFLVNVWVEINHEEGNNT
jgi:hypothetical protein